MRRTAIMAILAILLAFSGMAFAFDNEPEGFRGLKWGDPPTEEMEKLSEGLMAMYQRPSDRLSLGDAEFDYIFYMFYQDRFFKVSLQFKERRNAILLTLTCRLKFGKETSNKRTELCWVGSHSIVTLEYSSQFDQGNLSLENITISEELTEAIRKLATEKTAEDW